MVGQQVTLQMARYHSCFCTAWYSTLVCISTGAAPVQTSPLPTTSCRQVCMYACSPVYVAHAHAHLHMQMHTHTCTCTDTHLHTYILGPERPLCSAGKRRKPEEGLAEGSGNASTIHNLVVQQACAAAAWTTHSTLKPQGWLTCLHGTPSPTRF